LSFTPRSSLRRATMAAIEISSLSFSRGDRFMRTLWCWEELVEPQARQRDRRCAAEHRHHIGAEPRCILGTEARHCKSIPAGDADFATERFRCFTDPLHESFVAGNDQRRANRDTAICNGWPRQL